jgi:hypothetical protein
MKIRDSVNDAADTVNQIHDLQAQLKDLEKRLADDPKAGSVVAAAKELGKKLTALEEELIEPKIEASEDSLNYPVRLRYKLVAFGQVVESADAAPRSANVFRFATRICRRGRRGVDLPWCSPLVHALSPACLRFSEQEVPRVAMSSHEQRRIRFVRGVHSLASNTTRPPLATSSG